MEIRQKTELRRLLAPQLKQSLKILTLPLMDLKTFVEEELLDNPFLEETQPKGDKLKLSPAPLRQKNVTQEELDFRLSLVTEKISLQGVLLRQLGMVAVSDEEFKIGQEIIGNIDDNGYLKTALNEIAATLNTPLEKVENMLGAIQQFDPPGVAARTISECLLIQLKLANEDDSLLEKIIECYLEDIAKKNYSHIAKALKAPQELVEECIKKVLKLDPKPGRNYSSERIQQIIPDITINEKDEELEIAINDEDIPTLNINKTYKDMLKNNTLEPQAKEFLSEKLRNALELLRAISKRKFTLRKIVEIISEIQQEAIKNNLSHLKPLTFQEVALRLNIHESTVCRAIMNKYVQLPYGTVALK
ncbi:MAG: RNA polymerase factor sigma-54, partial [Candidatus Omnitrophica bacterium]|nr:RNA polymerase factor sigma-54 [Candidatus Omnitrophota bacterium]